MAPQDLSAPKPLSRVMVASKEGFRMLRCVLQLCKAPSVEAAVRKVTPESSLLSLHRDMLLPLLGYSALWSSRLYILTLHIMPRALQASLTQSNLTHCPSRPNHVNDFALHCLSSGSLE